MIDLKGRRELFWDTDILESFEGIMRTRHSPVYKNECFKCDAPWESEHCCYGSSVRVGDEIRFYYRAENNEFNKKGLGIMCLATSRDGKTFEKKNIGTNSFGGSFENNIFHSEEREIDNFSVVYDTNPGCPENERFKAVSLVSATVVGEPERLALYVSADGIKFEFKYFLAVEGNFDSHNVLFYDESIGKYRLYFRRVHYSDNTEFNGVIREEAGLFLVRDVRLSFSEDLLTWTEPVRLDYGDDDMVQMYTNQIVKYPRADVYVGFPTRYIDRRDDPKNFKYLSDKDGWRSKFLEIGSRGGTAITDCGFMYSKDGLHFKREGNAFLSADYEQGNNWIYGDFYLAYGLVETESDSVPGVMEYSFYTPYGYHTSAESFLRYTIRLDGFYSLHADYTGGEFLTKPMTLGDTMKINFKTSALGNVRIVILDEDGNPIEGYDSGNIFGNSTERPVEFERPLSNLSGKAVRLKFIMNDADVYSICCDI